MLRIDLEMFRESIISSCASSLHGGTAGIPSGWECPFSSHACLYFGGTKWECVSIL